MIAEDERHGALLCVQDFVRGPHFTHRNSFSDSCVAMLTESESISSSITTNAVNEVWSHVGTPSRSQVVTEVYVCVDPAVDCRRAFKDTRESGVKPSSENLISRTEVPIPSIVEEGRIEYVHASAPSISIPGPSNLRCSSGKSKKNKVSRSPVNPRRRLKLASSPETLCTKTVVEDSGFSAALDRQQSRRKTEKHCEEGKTTELLFSKRVLIIETFL